MEDNSFGHYFNEHFYTKLHGLLNFLLFFESHNTGMHFSKRKTNTDIVALDIYSLYILYTLRDSVNANVRIRQA